MKFLSYFCSFGLLFFPFSVFSAELPLPTKDYSADFTIQMTQSQGAQPLVIPGKIYYSQGNERRETEMMGRKNISIRRLDKQVNWILMPENRMYMETSLTDRQQKKDPAAAVLDQDLSITKLGREKVNGVMTDKYRILVADPQAEPMEGFLWLSAENIPIRMEGVSQQQGQTSTFVADTSNLKLGRQPAELFNLPAGYQRLQVPTFGGFGRPAGKSTMQPDAPPPGAGGLNISPEQMEQLRLQMEKLKQQMGAQ